MNPEQKAASGKLYVGIDISAATASVALLTDAQSVYEGFTIEQTEQGITLLGNKLLETGHAPEQVHIVMEATGTYWMKLASQLHQKGFRMSVINPSQAHHFAQARLQRAKTDEVDAETLAFLALQMQPLPWSPAPEVYEEQEQRLVERNSLLSIRQQLRNQLHALHHRPRVISEVERRKQTLLATIQSQIEVIEREIEALMRQEDAWQPRPISSRASKG